MRSVAVFIVIVAASLCWQRTGSGVAAAPAHLALCGVQEPVLEDVA